MKKLTWLSGVIILVLLGLFIDQEIKIHQLNKKLENEIHYAHEQEEIRKSLEIYIYSRKNYLTHEDIKEKFNLYASTNRIVYDKNDYYFDIKEIQSHTFTPEKEYPWMIKAKITFLKDQFEDNASYLNTKLSRDIVAEVEKLEKQRANEHESDIYLHNHEENDEHNHDHEDHEDHDPAKPLVTKKEMIEIENKLKERLVVSENEMNLLFKTNDYNIEVHPETFDNILELFVRNVVLNGKAEKVQVENQGEDHQIHAVIDGKHVVYSYDHNTKEIKEISTVNR